MAETKDILQEKLDEYRVTVFEELGFSNEEAELLANAKKVVTTKSDLTGRIYIYEVPVYHGDIEKMLKAGATKDQVLRIIL